MIGSALSRISMADKLSIPQLQQAIQDGTIPAYVGVPLLQDKVKQAKQSQALTAPTGQPPIAQQVMQEAQGLSAAQSNLPEFTAFDGGIVAFAGGDLVDDEEDDTDEDRADRAYAADRDELLNQLIASRSGAQADMSLLGLSSATRPMAPGEGAGITAAPRISAPPSEGIAAVTPGAGVTIASAKEERKAGLRVPSGHKYEKEIIREAERAGVDPDLALKVAMLEVRPDHKNPETATSPVGARGIMQLMPGTAKEMGVTDVTNPEQNIRGGIGYFKRMLDKYGDPKIAGAAYNWGPGNVDRWLKQGADPNKLPMETRKYIASLKEGGEVKRFANEGLVGNPMGDGYSADDLYSGLPESSDYATQIKKAFGFFPEYVGSVVGAPGAKPLVPLEAAVRQVKIPTKEALAAAAASRTAAPIDYSTELGRDPFGVRLLPEPPTGEEDKKAAEAKEKPAEEPKDTFAEYLKRREETLSKRKEEDKYMSILAAGLGMMSGTSPHALSNVGAGAMKGIETAAALSKERGLQERALLKGQIDQARAQETAALRKGLREDELKKAYTAQVSRDYDAAVKAALARRKVGSLDELMSSTDQQSVLREAEQSLMNNPGFQEAYRRVYGKDYAPASASGYKVLGVKKGS